MLRPFAPHTLHCCHARANVESLVTMVAAVGLRPLCNSCYNLHDHHCPRVSWYWALILKFFTSLTRALHSADEKRGRLLARTEVQCTQQPNKKSHRKCQVTASHADCTVSEVLCWQWSLNFYIVICAVLYIYNHDVTLTLYIRIFIRTLSAAIIHNTNTIQC